MRLFRIKYHMEKSFMSGMQGLPLRFISVLLCAGMFFTMPVNMTSAECSANAKAGSTMAAGGMVVPGSVSTVSEALGSGNAEASVSGRVMTISLKNDITLESPLHIIKSDKSGSGIEKVVLNLNGHTLSGKEDVQTIQMTGNYDLTINGGSESLSMPGKVIGGPGSAGRNGQGAVNYMDNLSDPSDFPEICVDRGAHIIGGKGGVFPYEMVRYCYYDDYDFGLVYYNKGDYTEAEYTIPAGGYGIGSENMNITMFRVHVAEATVTGGDASSLDISTNEQMCHVNVNDSNTDMADGGNGGCGIFLSPGLKNVIVDKNGAVKGGSGACLYRSDNWIYKDEGSDFVIDANDKNCTAGDGGAGILAYTYLADNVNEKVSDRVEAEPGKYGCQILGTVTGGNGGSAKGRSTTGGSGGCGIYFNNGGYYADNDHNLLYFKDPYNLYNASGSDGINWGGNDWGGSVNIASSGSVSGGKGGNCEWSKFSSRGGDGIYNYWVYVTVNLDGVLSGGDGGSAETGFARGGNGGSAFNGINQEGEYYGVVTGSGVSAHGNGGTGYLDFNYVYAPSDSAESDYLIDCPGRYCYLSEDITGRVYTDTYNSPPVRDGTTAKLVYSGESATTPRAAGAGDTIRCEVTLPDGSDYTGGYHYSFYAFGSEIRGGFGSKIGFCLEPDGNTYTITDNFLDYISTRVNNFDSYSAISFYAIVALDNGVVVMAEPVGMTITPPEHLPMDDSCWFFNEKSEIYSCVEARCGSCEGIQFIRCGYCGATKLDIIEPDRHDYVFDNNVPSECEFEGYDVYICSLCGESYFEWHEKLGHVCDEKDIIKNPSCATQGRFAGTCTRCGEIYYENNELHRGLLPALGHLPGDDKKEIPASCTADGMRTYTCTRDGCGRTVTEIIPALGHHMVHTAGNKASCTEKGSKEYWYCTRCDKYYSDNIGKTEFSLSDIDINATGHDAVSIAEVPPSYTTPGRRGCWRCRRCNTYFADADCSTVISKEDLVIPALAYTNPSNAGADVNNSGNYYYDNTTVSSVTTVSDSQYIYLAKKGFILTDKSAKSTVRVTKPGTVINGKVVGAEAEYYNPTQISSTVKIPSSVNIDGVKYAVTGIRKNAFRNNRTIKKVIIGSNVRTISAGCFRGCSALKTLTIKSKQLTKIGKNALSGINKKAVITLPKNKYGAYKKMFTSGTGYRKTMKLKK